ncbi:hypothetical protein [Aliidiomarina soli]|uniref:Uncharacterized protein n=1 Tax=Aliidiomarina soli TaxID=1928574 RepID=A0A432WM92_9GAMM|nr:hypothetical protein [Aliidiomarina soli]RUO34878.1 hypothetical protein CWE14_02450 [Aliidiomarina soli]
MELMNAFSSIPTIWVYILASLSVVILLTLFACIPFRVIFTQRPLIVSSRVVAASASFFIGSMLFVWVMSFGASSHRLEVYQLITPVAFLVILLAVWIRLKGYTVMGRNIDYFRDAIMASVKSLGFTAEESTSGKDTYTLRIEETGAEIQFVVIRGFGAVQIMSANKQSKAITSKIATEMESYFKNHQGKMNYVLPSALSILCFMLIAFNILIITTR